MGFSTLILLGLLAFAPPERIVRTNHLDPVGTHHIPLGVVNGLNSLKSYVEAEGGFSPGFATYGISYWVYDRTSGKLHAGTDSRPVDHGLDGVGRLIPWSRWSAEGVEVWSETCQVERDVEGGKLSVLGARGRLRNTGRDPRSISLFVAIRPMGPAGGPIDSLEIGEAGRIVKINGHVAVYADPIPTVAGTASTDLLEKGAWEGRTPEAQEVQSPTGDGAGLLRYDLTLTPGESRLFRMVCPVLAGRRAVAHLGNQPSKNDQLQPDLNVAEIKLMRVDDLFYRAQSDCDNLAGQVKLKLPDRRWSEAYTAITAHIALAMTDSSSTQQSRTLMANLLQKSGRPELAEPFTTDLVDPGSPGSMLWLIGEHWRFTQDYGWLIRVRPRVSELASRIRDGRTKVDESTEAFNIAGLRAAAILSRRVGDQAESNQWNALTDQRLKELSSATDSRASNVLWPCHLVPVDHGWAYDRFHLIGSQDWTGLPSVTLTKAHQGLLTGNSEAGYGTLNNAWNDSSFKGWYTLKERGESPIANSWKLARTNWNSEFAMPAGRSIAEFALLLRDCLAFEDGDQIVLLAGVPPGWFRDPKGFAVENMPTYFGPLSFSFEPTSEGGLLQLTEDAKPPAGFRVQLPKGSAHQLIRVGETSVRLIIAK